MQEVAGILGLAAPIFVFICVFGAISSWSSFSWTSNALSDLGVQPGVTEILFNTALIIAGFLFGVFAGGLWTYLGRRNLGKLGVCMFLVACAALVCIGIFNESFHPTHYIVSVMLFVFMPLSLLTFVPSFWLDKKRGLSVFTLSLGLVAALVWTVQFLVHPFAGVAIPECVSGLAGGAWTIVMGYFMLKDLEKASLAESSGLRATSKANHDRSAHSNNSNKPLRNLPSPQKFALPGSGKPRRRLPL